MRKKLVLLLRKCTVSLLRGPLLCSDLHRFVLRDSPDIHDMPWGPCVLMVFPSIRSCVASQVRKIQSCEARLCPGTMQECGAPRLVSWETR